MPARSIVLQAGGQSTRMGEDKGLMPFGQANLVDYILEQVVGLGDEVLVISNQPEVYAYLGFPVYTDVRPGIGALGGLLTALTYSNSETALVLACDMPFINRHLVNFMIDQMPGFDVVVPVFGEEDFIEPFRGLYAKACLAAIEQAVQAGKRRAIAFHPDVRVRLISPEEVGRFDPEGRTFINVNTREDYQRALDLLKKEQFRK
jgi:molybdenum cofactor guanylyltransferase